MAGPISKDRSVIRFYWLAALVVAPSAFIICRLLNFNGLFGPDCHDFLHYSASVAAYLTGGPEPDRFQWPVLYPALAALIQAVVPLILSLQVISVISSVICFQYFCKTLSLLYPIGRQRQRYAIVFFLGSPFILRAMVSAMPDMLCCMWLCGMVYFQVKSYQSKNITDLVRALIFGLLAIQTRYSAAVMLIPLIPQLISATRERYSSLLFLIGASVIAFTPTILLHAVGNLDLFDNMWLQSWSPANFFKSDFIASGYAVSYTLPNIIAAFALFVHPGFCFVIPILLYFYFTAARKPHRSWWITVVIYILFVAGLPVQNLRFLIPVFPLVLLLLYPAFEPMMALFRRRNTRVLLLSIFIFFQLALTARAVYPYVRYQREELEVVRMLKHYPPVDLYTASIDGALHTYGVPQEVHNLWLPQSSTLPPEALMLYHPDRMGTLSTETPPVILFRQLKREGRLHLLNTTATGWQLYTVD